MSTNPDAKMILDLWHYAEGLKLEERVSYLSNGRHESVAEHSWRMAFMIMMIAPNLQGEINIERALKIAIVHDIVEIEAKDVGSLIHFGNKEVTRKKEAAEKAAMKNIKKRFGVMGREISDLWEEYEEQETAEAKVVKVLDKLDARVQAIDDESMGNFSDEKKEMVQRLSKFTKKLCSADQLLTELDRLSLKERQDKWGF